MTSESISTDFLEVKVKQESDSLIEPDDISLPMSNYAVNQQDIESSYKSVVKLEPSSPLRTSPHFVSCNENFDEETEYTRHEFAAETSGGFFSQDPLEMKCSEDTKTNSSTKLSHELGSEHVTYTPGNSSALPLEYLNTEEDEGDFSLDRTFKVDIEEHPIDVKPQITESASSDNNVTLPNSESVDLYWPFRCTRCPRKFKLLGNFSVHQRYHPKEKMFTCEQCNMSFNRSGHLDRHLMTHSGIFCEKCGKTFPTQKQLWYHIRLHNKQHLCEVCGKVFSFNSGLEKHLISHTGKGAYRCSACDQSFTTKDKLQAHVLKHLDKRPFKCSSCKRTFKRKDTLDIHLECYSSGKSCKPIICSTCEECFGTKHQLYDHQGRQSCSSDILFGDEFEGTS